MRPFLLTRQAMACASRQLQPQRRALLSTTSTRRADMVQDLYLRELKNYKPTPLKASDAEGHVLKFNVPRTPPSPEESDLAEDLKAYENQQVEVEGQAAAGAPEEEHDWFQEDPEWEEYYRQEAAGESGKKSEH